MSAGKSPRGLAGGTTTRQPRTPASWLSSTTTIVIRFTPTPPRTAVEMRDHLMALGIFPPGTRVDIAEKRGDGTTEMMCGFWVQP